MGIDFASLSGPRHMHPPWNTGGRMSEDDLVRFFRSDLGDTSRDGGACMPLHPSPPAPTPASRRDRACRDLDLPKKLLSRKWLFCDAKSWRTLAPHTTSTTANTTHHSPHHNTRGRGKRRGGREFIFRGLLASKTTVARADLFSFLLPFSRSSSALRTPPPVNPLEPVNPLDPFPFFSVHICALCFY